PEQQPVPPISAARERGLLHPCARRDRISFEEYASSRRAKSRHSERGDPSRKIPPRHHGGRISPRFRHSQVQNELSTPERFRLLGLEGSVVSSMAKQQSSMIGSMIAE